MPTKYLLTDPPRPSPTISIVTPSFQQGRFLEQTLYSVVGQNYPALEYIVQDGGSSDETLDILHRFDHLLAGWTSEPDAGQAEAINRGFGQTSGEIMGWLNSDDLLLPGALAYVARYFASHPDVDVVYGHRLVIDERERMIGSWILPRHSNRALMLADYVPQETLFWRRRIWDAVGGSVDPSFRYALDWDILLRFQNAGARIVRLPRFMGAFRVHNDQKTLTDSEVGVAECLRLLTRVHGRAVSRSEVIVRLLPYLLRHVVLHAGYRSADRLRQLRRHAQTIPLEQWLRAPQQELAHDVGDEAAPVQGRLERNRHNRTTTADTAESEGTFGNWPSRTDIPVDVVKEMCSNRSTLSRLLKRSTTQRERCLGRR